MRTYPHDEFDDIDEATARRGIYRGTIDDPAKDPRGAVPLVIAGALALVLGASMYVMAPRHSAPAASSGSKAYAGKALPSSSAAAEPSAGEKKSEEAKPSSTNTAVVTLAVYNSSAPAGSAARASEQLQGRTISETGNWTGNPPETSTIYYRSDYKEQAEEIARIMGISTTKESNSAAGLGHNDMIVVLAEDYQG